MERLNKISIGKTRNETKKNKMKYTCSEISNNCIAFNYRYTCMDMYV